VRLKRPEYKLVEAQKKTTKQIMIYWYVVISPEDRFKNDSKQNSHGECDFFKLIQQPGNKIIRLFERNIAYNLLINGAIVSTLIRFLCRSKNLTYYEAKKITILLYSLFSLPVFDHRTGYYK
jgi:hypothetical protein